MSTNSKPFWRSKRFYATIATAVLPLIPPVGAFAAAYPEAYSGALAVVFGWVGIKTTKPIKFELPKLRKIP